MARRRTPAEFPLAPRRVGQPIHRWLYEALREAIVAGRLSAGATLPSTRELAQQHHVARAMVVGAYEQLQAEGYVVGRVGSGTVVAESLPDAFHTAGTRRVGAVPLLSGPPFSERARQWTAQPRRPDRPVRPFAVCVPGVEEFPLDEWARLTARRLRLSRSELLARGDARGWRPLREAVAEHLNATRSVRCEPEQVVMVSGTQQAFDFIGRLTLDPGEPVWVENPGYPGAARGFAAAGARVVPVPVDRHGLDLARARQRCPRPRLIYVTPAHQFPLGITMSLDRRLELLEFARREGAWIFEDDYDGDFRYDVRPIGCLQGQDGSGHVIYVGTFNKIMFPTLRLGYVVLPPRLVEPFLALRDAADRYLPTIDQAVLADFIREGWFARHVRKSRAMYLERRDTLLAAGERHLAGLLNLESTPAGFQLAASLPAGVADTRASLIASDHGVELTPMSRFYHDGSPVPHHRVLLGFAAFRSHTLQAAVRRLAAALGPALTAGAAR